MFLNFDDLVQVFVYCISFVIYDLSFFIFVYVLILLLDLLQVLWVLFTSRLDRCFWIIFLIDWNRPHNKMARCCLLLESLISMDRLDDFAHFEK